MNLWETQSLIMFLEASRFRSLKIPSRFSYINVTLPLINRNPPLYHGGQQRRDAPRRRRQSPTDFDHKTTQKMSRKHP